MEPQPGILYQYISLDLICVLPMTQKLGLIIHISLYWKTWIPVKKIRDVTFPYENGNWNWCDIRLGQLKKMLRKYKVFGNNLISVETPKKQTGQVMTTISCLDTGSSFTIPDEVLVKEYVCYPLGRDGHGDDNDKCKYKIGSLCAFGHPYFMIKNKNAWVTLGAYTSTGGFGLIDCNGKTIIPASDEIMGFDTRDYLPANTFYARLTNGRNRCYDANGNILAEGTYEQGCYSQINTLKDHFSRDLT